jgi:hypothetical protein
MRIRKSIDRSVVEGSNKLSPVHLLQQRPVVDPPSWFTRVFNLEIIRIYKYDCAKATSNHLSLLSDTRSIPMHFRTPAFDRAQEIAQIYPISFSMDRSLFHKSPYCRLEGNVGFIPPIKKATFWAAFMHQRVVSRLLQAHVRAQRIPSSPAHEHPRTRRGRIDKRLDVPHTQRVHPT